MRYKSDDIILRTVTKLAIFIILAFAVFLFLAGHHNPGGGFVGGLTVASAIVLLLLVFDMKTVKDGLPVDYKVMAFAGLLIAVTTGLGGMVFGQPFLSQAFGHIDLPLFGDTEFATAVIFDTGVALAVLGTALSIIFTISGDIHTWKR
ncbi:MAG TPA: Na(+)/H(+) antiporter subunit B [Clostridia bacterium]|nr:Na(+)/H(+) antiporter subunit B [Clostridia bacterium]